MTKLQRALGFAAIIILAFVIAVTTSAFMSNATQRLDRALRERVGRNDSGPVRVIVHARPGQTTAVRDLLRSKGELLSLIWGFDQYAPNLVEVHVSALRRKIDCGPVRLIHTERGRGYVLRP